MKKYKQLKKAGLNNYSEFMFRMIDKNIWAREKGRSRWGKDTINEVLNHNNHNPQCQKSYHQLKRDIDIIYYPFLRDQKTGDYIKDESGKCIKTDGIAIHHYQSMEHHLNACQKDDVNNYIYYVNDSTKQRNILTIDVDNKNNLPMSDVDNALEQLLSLFPNCYYDYGTSGISIHFYIIIDFDTTIDREGYTESEYRNLFFKNIVEYISNNITTSLSIDQPKGTCSSYKDNLIYNCGTLCKLPKVVTDEDYARLFNATTYNETISPLTLFSPYLTHKIVGTNVTKNIKTNELEYKDSRDKVETIDYSKEIDFSKYNNIEDTFRRIHNFVRDYIRWYYYRNNNIPELQEVCQVWFDNMSDPEKDSKREEIIADVYDIYRITFKKERIGDNYRLGKYNDHFEQYDMDDINSWIEDNTAYNRKIKIEDLDIIIGQIVYCFTIKNKDERLQNRISQTSLKKRYDDVKSWNTDKKLPGFDSKKVRAIFQLLISFKYIKCVDEKSAAGFYGKKYKPLPKMTELE